MDIKRADILAQSEYMRESKLHNLEVLTGYYKTIVEENQCIPVKDLAVTGKDLISLGMKPGKDLGIMLSYLLECVLEHPEWNDKETLVKLTTDKLNR